MHLFLDPRYSFTTDIHVMFENSLFYTDYTHLMAALLNLLTTILRLN